MKSIHLLALTALIIGSPAHAGLYIESVTRDKTTGKEEPPQTMQIQGGMARIESGARRSVTLFKNETLFMLDADRKSYTAMDTATLQRTMGAMNDMMQKMQAQLAGMPPEQRAQMEAMMKQSGMPGAGVQTKPAVYDATPTSKSERVLGHACKIWNITRDGILNSEVCVVSYKGLPGKDDVQSLAKKMSALLEKLPEGMHRQFSGNPFQQGSGVSAKLNGVPFITRNYRNGVVAAETTVKTWQEQAIAPAQFDIPRDFAKQETPFPQRKQ